MSDDDYGRAEQHLVNMARRRQAAQPPAQQPGKVSITRTAHFQGQFPGSRWLSIAWSPDGSQLAYGGHAGTRGVGILEIWNGETGHHETFSMRHLTHGVTGDVVSMAWSPDSRRLATVEVNHKSGERVVHVRGQAEGSRPIGVPPGLPVSQVTWSPDGTMLALSGPDCPQTVLVDPVGGGVRRVLDNLSGPVAWEPGGRLLAGLYETSVLLCDPATGGRLGRLAGQEMRPAALAWARHGKFLAVGDGEHIRVWDAESGNRLWNIPWTTLEGNRGPDGTVTSIDWLDGGRYLLEFRRRGGSWSDEWGSTCSTAILWDIEDHALFVELFVETIASRRQPIAGIAVAPDGRRCAEATDNAPPQIYYITGDLPHYVP